MRLDDAVEVRHIGIHTGSYATGMYPVLKDGDGVLFVRVDQSAMHRFTRVCRVGAIGEVNFHRFVINGREMLVLVPVYMNSSQYNLSSYMSAAISKLRDLLIYFFFESSNDPIRNEPKVSVKYKYESGPVELNRGRVIEL